MGKNDKAQQEAEYEITEDGRVIFHKQSGGEFAPVPVGDYELVVQSVEQRFGKESGEPYFAFEFRTVHSDPELDNKAVWENISPKAGWRLTQLHEAVNGKNEAAEEGTEMELNVFDLFGAHVAARLGLETGQDGKIRNKITRFYAAEVETPAAPTPQRATTQVQKPATAEPARRKRV